MERSAVKDLGESEFRKNSESPRFFTSFRMTDRDGRITERGRVIKGGVVFLVKTTLMILRKKEIKEIMEKYDFSPLKKMGQNFLTDSVVVDRIVSLVDGDNLIVEVGPGLGALTIEAAKRVSPAKSDKVGTRQFNRMRKIVAIEKDKKFIHILKDLIATENLASHIKKQEKYGKREERKKAEGKETEGEESTIGGSAPPMAEIEIIEEDILRSLSIPIAEDYTVLSNLPFYITSAVIRMFLEHKNPPKKMVLMIQKEVAKRICAKPPRMNLLAVSVQFYAEPKIAFKVSRNSFWPSPEIDCSVIVIDRKKDIPIVEIGSFFKVAKVGFSHPRTQLLNNFSKGLRLNKDIIKKWLISSSIDPIRRAETLSIKEWLGLTKTFKKI